MNAVLLDWVDHLLSLNHGLLAVGCLIVVLIALTTTGIVSAAYLLPWPGGSALVRFTNPFSVKGRQSSASP